jgi:hypothetical protein
MRRFRPQIALFAAYTLVLASVLGALSSASLAGTTHLQLCITSAQDGKPLPPAHSGDLGLCCFVANGGPSPALLPVAGAPPQPFLFAGEKIPLVAFNEIYGTEYSASHPRAPPALA